MSGSNATAVADDIEAALRAVPERTTAAWAAGDAAAFSAEFDQDAKVVIAGTYLRSHQEILKYVTFAFSGPVKGTRVVSDPVEILRLDRDTALVMTEGGVLVPGEAEIAPERALRGTWILSKRGEDWRITAYHSSPIKSAT
ncbi:MAG TPA: SgcJ/EcaC family oxidoreductase [Actinocrinis sp.]|jgi:uncharacterized protein (TIGR02246 family)